MTSNPPVTDDPFWDRMAKRMAASYAKSIGPNFAARVEHLATLVGNDASTRVLDVGCASGQIPLSLAADPGFNGQVVGVDISAGLIEEARRLAGERGVGNATFVVGTAADASLEPGTFDLATAFAVLHLVEDPRSLLERLFALLKPGGRLVSETPCLGGKRWLWGPVVAGVRRVGFAPRVVRLLREDQVEFMIREAGFELLESQVYNRKSGQARMTARKPMV